MLVVVTVPVLIQYSGYFIGSERLPEDLRMRHVIIIRDTAVLSYLLMVGREQQVRLIAVA